MVAQQRALSGELDPIVVRKSPLSQPVKKPKATRVRPQVLADIEYRAITADGRMRHGSFKGVREDLLVRGAGHFCHIVAAPSAKLLGAKA